MRDNGDVCTLHMKEATHVIVAFDTAFERSARKRYLTRNLSVGFSFGTHLSTTYQEPPGPIDGPCVPCNVFHVLASPRAVSLLPQS